ncbi:MAG: alpha/beta hydrolase [Spirulinaceae cyanobacterium SM2_1_0]|nr:alpha/beta hydrolase [Spirulinaceae cyanobacterium SM2_1_0]
MATGNQEWQVESIILGIHGLNNKPPQAQIEDWWRAAITEGLQKNCQIVNPEFHFELVYWADLLYKYSLHDDTDFSFDPLYNSQPYRPAQSGAIKEYKDGWLDSLQRGSFDVLGKTADSLRLRFEIEILSDVLLSRLLRDLHFYYDGDRFINNRQGQSELARLALRRELNAAIRRHASKQMMVVAHSMGSIVAYDALRDLGQRDPDLEVPYFVTIGAPLGLPYVKTKIIQERGYDPRVRTPSLVTERWVNFADKRDTIAVDAHLADDYGANRLGVQVEDDLIANDFMLRDGQPNYHKSYGYLRAPEFSRLVKEFLSR